MEVRGQLCGVSSLVPLGIRLRLSGLYAVLFLPTEPSQQPRNYTCIYVKYVHIFIGGKIHTRYMA